MPSPHLCPANQSLSTPWYEQGLTPCFNDLVSNSILCGIAVLLGASQAWLYYRRSTIHPTRSREKLSKLCTIHLSVHAALCILPIATLLTVIYRVQSGTLYTYQLIATIFKGEL